LADICGYELPTNLQNFTQKVKIFQKVLGGYFFETPCIYAVYAASGRSEAEVTIIKDCARIIVLLNRTTDSHEAQRGLCDTVSRPTCFRLK